MARVVEGSRSFTCHSRVYPQVIWTTAVIAFSSEAGPHLPTPERWKAELAWASQRWVNSRPRTATWRIWQLLDVQTVTPHWASGCTQLVHSCYSERGWQASNSWPLWSRATTLTTTPLSHPNMPDCCNFINRQLFRHLLVSYLFSGCVLSTRFLKKWWWWWWW